MTPAAAIEAALHARVARPSERAAAARGAVVFHALGVGEWTVRFGPGGPTLSRSRPFRRGRAATLVADAHTLLEVIEGRQIGVEAFLRGRISVRGNLALSLELDELLPPVARDPRAPRCRRVDVGGVSTFYLEAGPADGPPVLLLHGLGATSASFLPTVFELARDHRVIAVDLPGFGESDKPRVPLDPAYYARWAVAFLDALSIPRAHVVGNSMGGRIGLELALRAPERVHHLALLAPSMAWLRFRFAVGIVRLLRPELAFLPLPILHFVVVLVLRWMFARPDRIPRAHLAAAADEFVRVWASGRGRVAFLNVLREIYLEHPFGEHGFWSRLPRLSVPALFVFGHHDRFVPRGFARHVGRALPAATRVTFEDCGHVPQFELPERTHALLRDFFDGHLTSAERAHAA